MEEEAYIALNTEQKTLIALDAFGNVAKVPGGVEVISFTDTDEDVCLE